MAFFHVLRTIKSLWLEPKGAYLMDSEAIYQQAVELRNTGCSHMFIPVAIDDMFCTSCGKPLLVALIYGDGPREQSLHAEDDPHMKIIFSCECTTQQLGTSVNGIVMPISHAAPNHRAYSVDYTPAGTSSRVATLSHNHSRSFGQPGILIDPFEVPKPPSG